MPSAPNPPPPSAPVRRTAAALPAVIQGGMGVAISDWRLAQAAARAGALGVVSGTALDVVCARRLQDGDPDGSVRRALAALPLPDIAERIIDSYFIEGGRAPDAPYRPVPMFSARPSPRLQELTVAAGFVEVFLAREGHDGPVGINLLRKIEAPIPFVLYGAMLAGVDAVLIGAGNPHELPAMLTALARGQTVELPLRVQGGSSAAPSVLRFDPATLADTTPPVLPRPLFLAIVASNDLAEGLASTPDARPDALVVEGVPAGGHNAPPRGPRRTDERGQPIYDATDEVDLPRLASIGLPFWLGGGFGSAAGLQAAWRAGARGVQVGTAFALCADSGLAPALRAEVLAQIAAGTLEVRTDWRSSPTGFPFKVAEVPGTLSDPAVVDARTRVCDLGMLRVPYARDDGKLGYRCPAEPVSSYTEVKKARAANTEGRACLCNALLATAGLPQHRPDGTTEPALVTLGTDLTVVRTLLEHAGEDRHFTAAEVVAALGTTSERARFA